jgi:hypothetical protein
MATRLRLGVTLAVLVAACGSPTVTPPSVAPSPTWDPRRDQVDQAQAVWEVERPGTVAYTTVDLVDGHGTTSVRVTEMDGNVETHVLQAGSLAPADGGASLAIDSLFDRARAALEGDAEVVMTFDQFYGYPVRIEAGSTTADGPGTVEVTAFITPADRTGATRAREALDRVLQRWGSLPSPAWEYTWSRFAAADSAGTASTWRVRHEDGATTVSAEGGSGDSVPPEAVTIEGTVATAVSTLAAGGWVDVAADPGTLDLLIAIDPSPSMQGDAYWIRIDHTDLYAETSRAALEAAKDRWAAAGLERFAYAWRYAGEDGTFGWNVTINRDTAKLKPTKGAPPVEASFVAPRIPELFDLIDQVLASGGTVLVTYERRLGYPTRVEIVSAGDFAPTGVITITGLKQR